MAAHNCWASLPSVIVVEILSYLSFPDKLNTSSACKRWRSCLYHPSLWTDMTFRVRTGGRKKAKHLADMCGRFVKEAVVVLDSKISTNVRECAPILDILARNVNLEKFALRPNSCHLEWPERDPGKTIDMYLSSLEQLCGGTRRLRHLALGCVGELSNHADHFLSLLAERQVNTLRALHISSVKEDPDSYGLIDLPLHPFRSLYALQELGIDYDYLSSHLLRTFCQPDRARLTKLVIHVHGIELDREKISDLTWHQVVRANPKLEVTLNLIHSIDGAEQLLDILRPSMPLAHLRLLFCQHINVPALGMLARHYGDTLQSVHILDGMEEGAPNVYATDHEEDPFVMMAWKCPRLNSFSIIGYDLNADDLTAMVRLRGEDLGVLQVPQCCISTLHEDYYTYDTDIDALATEVSKWLGQPWQPLMDEELHPAVTDPNADAETAYLHLLLQDQAW